MRLLIVEDGRLAMIRRTRGGHVYHTLPGGGVEPGESFEETGRREAWEELGVEVELTGEPYDETFGEYRLLYYRARITGGEFGTGTWPDHAEKPPEWRAERGTYEACWIDLDRLPELENGVQLRSLLDGRPLIRMERFNHVTLTTADPERSRRFYIETFGLVPSTFSDGRLGVRAAHQWIEFRAAGPHPNGRSAPDGQSAWAGQNRPDAQAGHDAGVQGAPGGRPAPVAAGTGGRCEHCGRAGSGSGGRSDSCESVVLSFVSAVPLSEVLDHLERQRVPLAKGPVHRQDWLGELTLIAVRDPDGNLVEIATYEP